MMAVAAAVTVSTLVGGVVLVIIVLWYTCMLMIDEADVDFELSELWFCLFNNWVVMEKKKWRKRSKGVVFFGFGLSWSRYLTVLSFILHSNNCSFYFYLHF